MYTKEDFKEDQTRLQLEYIKNNAHKCSSKLINQIVEQIKAELK